MSGRAVGGTLESRWSPQANDTSVTVGGEYIPDPIESIDTERLRRNMNIGFESNFCTSAQRSGLTEVAQHRSDTNATCLVAYRETIAYLREQNNPNSTWTICTGSQGDIAAFVLPAMTQAALFPFTKAAARETEDTNVRFNEIYLCFRVENDADAVAHGVTKSSDFANVYRMLLDATDVRSSRVMVENDGEDLKKLRHIKKN